MKSLHMVEPVYLFCVTFWSAIRTSSIHRTARNSPFLYYALRQFIIIALDIKNEWCVSGCEYGSLLNFIVEQKFAVWTRFMDPFFYEVVMCIVNP